MLTLEPVKKRFGDYICRRCLNSQYKVHLEPRDCEHYYYGICRCCKEEKRVIISLRPSGKMKMLLK